jgi:hypothetical protein
MNQAEKQFNFDLQIFAEEEAQEIAPEATPEVTTETAPEPQATTEQDSQQEPEKHISEMTDDEQTEYIKKHFLNEGGRPKKEEQPQVEQGQGATQPTEPQAEPTFEITVQGEKKQVTQSELIKLAQMGEDYTRKTQALADQRRQFEAQVQQFQQRQQPQQQVQPQVNPSEQMNVQYKQAVAVASHQLGISPEDFNQFDPVHAFALQNVIVRANMQAGRQMSERQAVEAEIRDFMTEIQKDPMTQDVNNHFEEYILKRGMESRDGIAAAGAIAEAYSRFNAGTATKRDCAVLKEHWAYVKSQLSKAQAPVAPPAPPKPPIVPPKTETPGVGRSANSGSGVMDVRKLRSLANDPDRQMQYMKSLGIFND